MERKSFDELIQLKQDGIIGWVEFLQKSEYADEYNRWLTDRGATADEDNAELFFDMTDASFQDSQVKEYQ